MNDMRFFENGLERSLNRSFKNYEETVEAEGRAEYLDMSADLLLPNKAGGFREFVQELAIKVLRKRLLKEF